MGMDSLGICRDLTVYRIQGHPLERLEGGQGEPGSTWWFGAVCNEQARVKALVEPGSFW